MFFDAPAVMNSVDRATRKVLSRFGAFVRQRARSSIRKRKKPSAPGQPPSSHTGLLKAGIYFGYDAQADSVVIGPVALNAKGEDVPATLEAGGMATITFGPKIGQQVFIAARPFMGPALEAEAPQLPDMWKDAVIA